MKFSGSEKLILHIKGLTMELILFCFMSLISFKTAVGASATVGELRHKQANITANCSSNGICFPRDCNKYRLPSKLMNINVTIKLVQVTEIDDNLGTIDIQAYLTFEWIDNRLTLRNEAFENMENTHDDWSHSREIYEEWAEKLWTPNIFIYELKEITTPEFNKHYSGIMNIAKLMSFTNSTS